MVGKPWSEVTPAWVVPSLNEFAAYGSRAFRLEEVSECWQARGQCRALSWLTGHDSAPISGKEGPVTLDAARGESLLALCLAAAAVDPVEVEPVWELFGAPPSRPLVAGEGWWAHGVWRTLSWVVGDRDDPPIELPVVAEDGSILPGSKMYATSPDPDSPLWRQSEARREQRELNEAYQWWRRGPLGAYSARSN